ncbi:MAG: hypothetical protein GKR95_14210 [Gammaproteobacteria bacterium]|nr:hypothetical protein [Gammaproteobacteria bacterium]
MSKVLGVFDGALIVHAPHLVPERRESYERELRRVGVESFEIVNAVESNEELREHYNYIRPAHQNSVRALSVLLSIDKAIEKAQNRGFDSVLLMQDDVIFRDRFDMMWEAVVEEVLLTDWDMLFFYRWHSKPIREPYGRMRLVPIEHTLCSHCVGIKAAVFENIGGYFNLQSRLRRWRIRQ